MIRGLAALALGWVTLVATARAEAPRAFASLRDQARPLDSLTHFLDRYIGECNDFTLKDACLANAKKARAELDGKTFYLILDEEAGKMLKPGAYNPSKGELRIDVTPFFEGGGRALTYGTPKRIDAEGNVYMPTLPVFAKLDAGWTPMDLDRQIRNRRIRIQVVFKTEGVWSLRVKERSGTVEGVAARFLGLRLTHVRSGDEVAHCAPCAAPGT
jgi:hypothetical protein